jgi:hypothetical protein
MIFTFCLQADYIRWFYDYEKAHQVARKENKELMVLLVEKIDKPLMLSTFMNQAYIKTINERYIGVIIKKDEGESYPIELLYTMQYPSLFILDKYELCVCEALRGDINSDRLNAYLKECD